MTDLAGVNNTPTGNEPRKTYLINLDADPFVPPDWTVEHHQKQGSFLWNPAQVKLYTSPKQLNGLIRGDALRAELADKLVFNAVLLDYLYENRHLIPDEWKPTDQRGARSIFFWGTEYRFVDNLCVRCLDWKQRRWSWNWRWLVHPWLNQDPAAVRED